MQISSLVQTKQGITGLRPTIEGSSLGDYIIEVDYGIHQIYITREEAETLYSSLFEVLIKADKEPSNVRVLS